MAQRDYYEILEVTREVSDAELKSAFRKAAMKHHPDRNPGDPEAERRFKECNEAYSVLSDANKRAAYDRFGHAGVDGQGGGRGGFGGFQDAGDIFSEVFGDVFGEMFGGGRRASSGPQRGQDLRYDLQISLEQAFTGAEVPITAATTQACEACDGTGSRGGGQPSVCQGCNGHGRVRASQGFFSIERTCPYCGGRGRTISDPCRTCHGAGQVRKERTLSVRIPAGVDDGARIRLSGEGDAGQRGGPRGDLYIFLSVRPHDIFSRDGLDLHCEVTAPMWMAVLGGEIDAPALCPEGLKSHDSDACKAKVRILEGAQTGDVIRVKGRGMPSLRGREHGDLMVHIRVETPVRLNARQKELMHELADSWSDLPKHHPHHDTFFTKAKKFWDGVTGGSE